MIGLITWNKHPLEVAHASEYVADIRKVCDSLDTKSVHFNTQFRLHKQYGDKVHNYRRNKHTNWYIIYNIDSFGNIYIERIISNYLTLYED
ncbi:MAG: hypothetical protein PHV20_05895 [Bacteroidales bacterium]|nr:hypothetical protein [Bacteroidales bacterium]